MLDLVKTLADLVAIPSVNPMGRPVSGPEFLEYRVTEYLEALFTRLGLPWQRQTVEPKRDNILVRVEGTGPVILFEAHQDTVPVDGMTIEPWNPVIRDGRMYGRGSCDIKGGMTAMLGCIERLARERPAKMPTVVLACTVNEEHGFSGALELTQLFGRPGSLVPQRPEVCVVAEPTSLDVVVAHKGAVRWRCRTRGKACHSSQPHLGDNAVYKMARVLPAFEAYQREVAPLVPPHPLCGPATLSVGLIRGGVSVNTVPDECLIEIDRRLLPGEDGRQVFDQVVEFVAKFPGVNFPVEHETPFMIGPPLANEHNGPLAERLVAAARQTVGKGSAIGVPYGTDASKIAAAHVPSVVFGPGNIAQAHTCDEWLPLDELQQASDVLYRFVMDFARS